MPEDAREHAEARFGTTAAVMMRGTPAGKPGAAAAIGDAAVFLASAEASFVHGTILDVDGGRTSVAVIDAGAHA